MKEKPNYNLSFRAVVLFFVNFLPVCACRIMFYYESGKKVKPDYTNFSDGLLCVAGFSFLIMLTASVGSARRYPDNAGNGWTCDTVKMCGRYIMAELISFTALAICLVLESCIVTVGNKKLSDFDIRFLLNWMSTVLTLLCICAELTIWNSLINLRLAWKKRLDSNESST